MRRKRVSIYLKICAITWLISFMMAILRLYVLDYISIWWVLAPLWILFCVLIMIVIVLIIITIAI